MSDAAILLVSITPATNLPKLGNTYPVLNVHLTDRTVCNVPVWYMSSFLGAQYEYFIREKEYGLRIGRVVTEEQIDLIEATAAGLKGRAGNTPNRCEIKAYDVLPPGQEVFGSPTLYVDHETLRPYCY